MVNVILNLIRNLIVKYYVFESRRLSFIILEKQAISMKKVFLIISTLLLCSQVWGQKYVTAAGVRLGSDWGITLQQRVLKKTTVEGILQSSFKNDNTTVSVLLEQHQPLIGKRLNFYLGGGLHKTWIPQENFEEPVVDPFGLALVAGAEFTLGRLNFSFDYKPLINLTGDAKAFDSQGGLSMRYVFIKKMKRKNPKIGNSGKKITIRKRRKNEKADCLASYLVIQCFLF